MKTQTIKWYKLSEKYPKPDKEITIKYDSLQGESYPHIAPAYYISNEDSDEDENCGYFLDLMNEDEIEEENVIEWTNKLIYGKAQ